MPNPSHTALDVIRNEALRLDGDEHDYDALLDSIGDRSLVLLGEATHGTREFYRMRAELTLRLVVEQGFDAIAVEADWPDAYRLNLFVRGEGPDHVARSAFDDFQRFPRWMWRNEEVLRFVERLRDINMTRQASERIGFYGLDMYSMYRSANAVVDYLSTVDEEQAAIARKQYAALDHVRDPQRYGYEAVLGLRPDCREAVRQRLLDLWTLAPEYLSADGRGAVDAYFFAERNAHVVASAESYYRAMFGSRAASWNVRDEHMVQTLFALQAHLRALGSAGKVVVWAHNSHLGDARATEMSRAGEWNVGQLVRERAGAEAAWLVGFTTYTGTVTAAPMSGTARPSAARSRWQDRTVTRTCSIAPGWTAFTCRCRKKRRACCAIPCSSGPSACCTARIPSTKATISRRRSPRSSTRCSISMKPPRSSRWTRRRHGSKCNLCSVPRTGVR